MNDVDEQLRQVAAHLRLRTSPALAPVQPIVPAPKWRFSLRRDEAGLIIDIIAERID